MSYHLSIYEPLHLTIYLPIFFYNRTPDTHSPQHSQNRALSPLEQNNLFLRGRVEQLESQNKHLEKYITQLKAHQ